MRNKLKKLASLGLALSMLLGFVPVDALAREEAPQTRAYAQQLAGEPDNQYQELNWDLVEDEDTTNNDYYWPLNQFSDEYDQGGLPYQRLISVSQYEPIRLYDIKYEGYYYNDEARLVLRLSNNFHSSAGQGNLC